MRTGPGHVSLATASQQPGLTFLLNAAVLGKGVQCVDKTDRLPAPTELMMFCREDCSGTFLLSCFCFSFVSQDFSPNTFKPDLLFRFSQTPTSGNTNIVKFFPIILLLKVKTMTVDSLTGKINKVSFCLNVKVLCLLFAE